MDEASAVCMNDATTAEHMAEESNDAHQVRSHEVVCISSDSPSQIKAKSPDQQSAIVEVKPKKQKQKVHFLGSSTFLFTRRTPEFIVQNPKKTKKLKLEIISLHQHNFRVEPTYSKPRIL